MIAVNALLKCNMQVAGVARSSRRRSQWKSIIFKHQQWNVGLQNLNFSNGAGEEAQCSPSSLYALLPSEFILLFSCSSTSRWPASRLSVTAEAQKFAE